jgi:hypothetical protein
MYLGENVVLEHYCPHENHAEEKKCKLFLLPRKLLSFINFIISI